MVLLILEEKDVLLPKEAFSDKDTPFCRKEAFLCRISNIKYVFLDIVCILT